MTTIDEKPLVLVVDDDPQICSALALLLQLENMDVETFESAEDFLRYVTSADFDSKLIIKKCAIFDICLPGMNGLNLQETLNDKGILMPIIFLTGHGDIPMSVEAIKAGAENFLTKPVSREKLMESVHSALRKGMEWLIQQQQRDAARKRLSNLTSRELEILAMTIEGLPNKLIARHLDISLRTVEHHKASILNKTEAANSVELNRLVQDSGMIFV